MKRIAFIVALITVAMLIAWPYVHVHRFDRALKASDLAAIGEMVDLDAVKAQVRKEIAQRVDRTLGGSPGSMLGWLQDGVKRLGNQAIDMTIDAEWIHDTLQTRLTDETGRMHSLISTTTYAFYEHWKSWDRFVVRIIDNGRPPFHVQWERSGSRWRITALYEEPPRSSG